MQSSFTPGPWFVPTPIYRTLYVEARVGNGMLQEVASCGPTAEPSQQAANARLIAAAPELLEALRGMLALDEEHHQRGHCDDDVCAEVRKARAAIAKATGSEA